MGSNENHQNLRDRLDGWRRAFTCHQIEAVSCVEVMAVYPQLSAEAQFEVEMFLKLSGPDVAAAATFRSAWYRAVRRFFEEYDYFILPSAQVFPFDAKTRWPREIAGTKMDAYNRWMEVMVPVTMSGCPAVNVPVGFNATGLPMGLQIMASNHAERSCLELAYAYDQVTRWVERRPPPMLTFATN